MCIRDSSWTPTNKNAGTYTVYILAKDNGSPILNAKRSFTVTVNNLAPTLTLPYTYSTGSEGNTVSFNMTASDPDGDSTSIEVTRVYKGSTQVSVPVGSTSGSATSTICPLVSGYNHRWCWDPAGNPPGPDWTDGGAYWYIYVKATDSQGAASAEKVFTYYIYDVPPPKLTITYAEPTTHYYAYTSNYYNISANAQTSYGGNNIDYIEFKDLYGFETYTTYCYGSSNCNGSARFHFGGGFYSPSYYGWHYIQVTARDTKGQITKMTYSVYVN